MHIIKENPSELDYDMLQGLTLKLATKVVEADKLRQQEIESCFEDIQLNEGKKVLFLEAPLPEWRRTVAVPKCEQWCQQEEKVRSRERERGLGHQQ